MYPLLGDIPYSLNKNFSSLLLVKSLIHPLQPMCSKVTKGPNVMQNLQFWIHYFDNHFASLKSSTSLSEVPYSCWFAPGKEYRIFLINQKPPGAAIDNACLQSEMSPRPIAHDPKCPSSVTTVKAIQEALFGNLVVVITPYNSK